MLNRECHKEVRTVFKLRAAAVLLVVVLSLVIAVPALADGADKADFAVQPTIGGPNNPSAFTPPGAPVVSIPVDNPAIGDTPAGPGDGFWPIIPQ